MELKKASLPAVVQKRQGQGSSSGGVGMFQTLGRGQREVRNHLAGCALGVFTGGDEQDFLDVWEAGRNPNAVCVFWFI